MGNTIECGGKFEPVIYITIHVVLRNISLRFSKSSEVNASEFLENL